MIKKHYIYICFIISFFIIQSVSLFALEDFTSNPVFFIGEDIIHPQGMIITVNEIKRQSSNNSFGLGRGNQVKKDDLFINLTLLNNGTKDQSIDLTNDFSLNLGAHEYKPSFDLNSRLRIDSLNVGAGTQSRIDLNFKINQNETEPPELLFCFHDSLVRIICDEKLGKIVTDSGSYNPSDEDIAKTAKILLESGRLTAAKNLCEPVLLRNPNDCKFLLLMAKVYKLALDEEQATYYLQKIDVTKMRGPDEAEEAALLAISIDNSEIALSLLEAYNAVGLLNDDQKSLLARAYYYENQLDNASIILNKLFESGYTDSKAYFTMGNVYNKKYDNETAIYYWEKAVEKEPDYSEALFNIGVGYYKLGDIKKARSYWEKVIDSDPDSKTLSAANSALKDTEDM